MSNTVISIIWVVLYILCAGLGFIQEPEQQVSTALTLLSICFFIPGFVLLYRGQRKPVGIVSAVSLVLTLAAILLNIWSVSMTESEGTFVYTLLGLVSAPMLCSQVWVLSLFLWACLLMGAVMGKRKKS